MPDTARTPPETFELVRYGRNVFTRDGRIGEFDFSGEDAEHVIAEFEDRRRDLVIDFEHQTLSGEKAPAAGWIDKLEKGTDGLIAHVKYWTDTAADYLRKGEYRYFSPTLLFDGDSVSSLHSVALTNHPALHKLDALVAGDVSTTQTRKGKNMPEETQRLALTDEQIVTVAVEVLGLNDTTAENVRGKLLALKTQAGLVPGLRAELQTLKDLQTASYRRLKLDELLATGRLSQTQAASDYFARMSLADLDSYKNATPEGSVVPISETAKKPEDQKRKDQEETEELSPMAKMLGVTDADVKKYKGVCQ